MTKETPIQLLELHKYLEENLIRYTSNYIDTVTIDEKNYFIVMPDELNGNIIGDGFILLTEKQDTDRYVFKFGGNWYWSESRTDLKLNPLKYIGKANISFDPTPFLGVHTKYEILNGSRDAKDWCKKAKFLGINTLGVCEKNTLSGTLPFQLECKKQGIISILGATYTVDRLDCKYDIKVYAKNLIGWENMLSINKEVRATNHGYILEKDFFDYVEGLIVVIDPKSIDFDKIFPIQLHIKDLYYQLDTVEYVNNDRDTWYLENLKKFVRQENIQPVIITDAYYLDKEHAHIKKKLNTVNAKMEYEAVNQHFKCFDEFLNELVCLFNSNDETFDKVLKIAIENTLLIAKQCKFNIATDKKHLPKYKMNEQEAAQYETNEDLFWALIDKGLSEKCPEGEIDKYLARIEEEVEVIKYGNLIDYFLINYDQVKWCKENDIPVGLGRGSGSGSLISYFCQITKVDPIKYGLLFSRFLTKARAIGSIADIDIDTDSIRKDEVKEYHRSKYGEHQCASVGTYTTLQLKAAFRQMCDLHNIPVATAIDMSKCFDKDSNEWQDIFRIATDNPKFKSFVQHNFQLINDIRLILGSIKSESTHASAFIITPDDKEIYLQMPVRKEISEGKQILITEWEGYDLDNVGFLKQDILSLSCLCQIKSIFDSIKSKTGKILTMETIPLDDNKTFEYFSNGFNENVFQFEGKGLSGYTKELKPNNIQDIIATVALYRPGSINNGYHTLYSLIKNGEKEPEYIRGWENITSNTYSVICYQEQAMRVFQEIGGFNTEEVDVARKSMGKKLDDLMQSLRQKFIEGGLKNGYTKEELVNQWNIIQSASAYLFNYSHSVTYGITGYITQYLKVNYPIHFWTTAFTFADDKQIAGYISEIYRTGSIKISPPNINISTDKFTTDFENNTIVWGLLSIKQIGQVAVEDILQKRNKKKEYFSFEEFFVAHSEKGSKVNKTTYENLILAGAFDEIESIKDIRERKRLIEQYRQLAKVKIAVKESDWFNASKEYHGEIWWWALQQKKLSGFALFDYESLLKDAFPEKDVLDLNDLTNEGLDNNEDYSKKKKEVCVGGILTEIIVRSSKKYGESANMVIECNYTFINVYVKADAYEVLKDIVCERNIGKLILLSGCLSWDAHKSINVVTTNKDTELIVLD